MECGYAVCPTSHANVVVSAPGSKIDRNFYKLPFYLQQELNRYLSVQALTWQDISATDLKPWTVPRPGRTLTEGRSFPEFHNLLAEKMKARGSSSGSVAPPLYNVTNEAEALALDPACESTRVPIFRGSLTLHEKRIHFRMAPPTWDISTRFYREFTYKRWLRVCVQSQLERKSQEPGSAIQLALTDFLSRPLVISGLHYRAVYHKDGSLFFFLEKGPAFPPILDFAFRHIDFGLNAEMTLAKFIARFSLGFSKTKATVTFPSTALRFVPDVTSTSMLIGWACMADIASNYLLLSYVPSAIRMKTKDVEVIYVLDHSQARGTNSDWITVTSDMFVTNGTRKLFKPTFSVAFIGRDGILTATSCEIAFDSVKDRHKLKLQSGPWPGVGEVMTDGNAAISRSGMIGVAEVLGLAEVPSCVQARIGGSKGVWYIDHEMDTSHEEPWIEIRESQHKYKERSGFVYVLEVVRWSAPASTAQIGKQMLQVLADRGVPNEIFTKLLSSAMQEKLEELLDWDNPSALRRAVEIAGRVKHNRAKLPAASPDAVVLLRSGSFNSSNDEDIDLRKESSSAGSDDSTLAGDEGYDLYSGMPKSAAEIVIEMIDAGFEPNGNTYMANKIKTIVDNTIDGLVKFRIPVAKSTTLYVMVDPVGCLAPNEIYVQLSDGIIDPETRQKIRSITGDVLVTRSPCVLPSDIRKVKAVDKLELRTYQDVVVFPRNGHRPLAGLLGGGDYDGDTICVVFEPSVVNTFTDAPETLAGAPFQTSEYFTKDDRTVEEVVLPLHDKDFSALHQLLLAPLFASRQYGMLSEMHTTCVYTKGLSDSGTIELAHLFAIALDSAKSGKCLRPEKASELRHRFNTTSKPEWTLKIDRSEAALDGWFDQKKMSTKAARRGRGLQEHVMDALAKMGDDVKVKHKMEIAVRVEECERSIDLHLSTPHQEYLALAVEDADLAHDMELVECHIKNMSTRFKNNMAIIAKGKNTPSSALGGLHIGSTFLAWQSAMQALRMDFVQHPADTELKSSIFTLLPDAQRRLKTLKASAAYHLLFREHTRYPTSGHRLNMPYALAFREMLSLKADAVTEEAARKQIGLASRGITAPRIIRPIWLDLETRKPPQKKRRISPTI